MRWIDAQGKFFAPPLVIDGMEHHSPTPELLIRAGYKPYVPAPRPARRIISSGGVLTSGGILTSGGMIR